MSSPLHATDGHSVHPADAHETIQIIGARQHSLKGVDVSIPKRRLTVFTGVSGSGKSSLVFSTLAAESQRMINETYSAFLQGMMPRMDRPDVDVLEGLTPAIIVNQERIGANARSTVGTVTDINPLLRILFSRLGEPHIGSPNAFSFNVATMSGKGGYTVEKSSAPSKPQRAEFSVQGGMCPRCEGMGVATRINEAEVIDDRLSLLDGAITVPGFKVGGWSVRFYSESGLFDPDVPVKDFTEAQRHDLLYRPAEKRKIGGANMTYQGLIPQIEKSMLSKDRESMQPHIRAFVDRAVSFADCPDCEGTRLNSAARSSLVGGINIAQACAMELRDLIEWVKSLDASTAGPVITALEKALSHCVTIGIGYLSLDRSSGTLSGGESQRVKMVRHLGSALTDVTYIFDEPSIGLHPADVTRMNTLLGTLRDQGNTVMVVEHKPEVIRIADHVVDMGPGAGAAGGSIVFTGTVDQLLDSDTVTGAYLRKRCELSTNPRERTGVVEIRGASAHNLQSVDVDIPLGVLTVVTGVAGSGKSTLIRTGLSDRDGVVTVDQSSIKGSRRSNPATYSGALDPIRKAFAKANGVPAALFSANSDGACPACSGAGVIEVEFGMVGAVASTCEECGGDRFRPEVADYTLGGCSIVEVLNMPISDAATFFGPGETSVPAAHKILRRVDEVGVGYLRLGQPLNTLSGGERQRMKLATHLSDGASVLVLDEPSAGLHQADVEHLLTVLDRLVDSGQSVVVIDHHLSVMAHADWIIDMGPGAGSEGGRVVFEGTPAEMVAQRNTVTAEHLAEAC